MRQQVYTVEEIIIGEPMETVEISTTTHIVPGKSPYLDPHTNTWWEYDEASQEFINTGVMVELPVEGTPGQVLTKTEDGSEWRDFEASVTEWRMLRNKPFEAIDTNAFEVTNGVITVKTTDDAVEGGTLPITSSGVHTIVGNIDTLLSLI